MPYPLKLVKNGEGPVLVLIHGIAGSHHIWDKLVPYLSKKYQVVALDLLGYGESPKPRIKYSPQAHIEAIHDTLQSHNIKPPYVLVGLSMGVNLALDYSIRWPEEVDGFIGIGFPYYPNEAAARRGLHYNFWTRLTIEHPILGQLFIPTIWWLGRKGILPSKRFTKIYTDAMAKDALLNPYYVFKSSLLYCMIYFNQTPLIEATAGLPRLFIHGDRDKWSAVQDLGTLMGEYPKTELQILPGVEHNTVVISPKQTADYILDYLSSLN
jgi:pimeloyl-ACP methyl ester carboxylesterase